MGGCSFPDCHNSSEKGFKMLRFSRLVEMRSKWASACKISKPITENSRLCEVFTTMIKKVTYLTKKNLEPKKKAIWKRIIFLSEEKKFLI